MSLVHYLTNLEEGDKVSDLDVGKTFVFLDSRPVNESNIKEALPVGFTDEQLITVRDQLCKLAVGIDVVLELSGSRDEKGELDG